MPAKPTDNIGPAPDPVPFPNIPDPKAVAKIRDCGRLMLQAIDEESDFATGRADLSNQRKAIVRLFLSFTSFAEALNSFRWLQDEALRPLGHGLNRMRLSRAVDFLKVALEAIARCWGFEPILAGKTIDLCTDPSEFLQSPDWRDDGSGVVRPLSEPLPALPKELRKDLARWLDLFAEAAAPVLEQEAAARKSTFRGRKATEGGRGDATALGSRTNVGNATPAAVKQAKLKPSQQRAAAAYEWALANIDGAESLTYPKLFERLQADPTYQGEGLPDNAETFARYCRAAGVQRNSPRSGREPTRSVRRASDL